ncbi:MAG TPA: aminodeoxychorismate synthase [Mycobacteriales bacterium]|jgi:uridine kinase|nr:aminodeoxychorismate synthase [Mycobacteriales bacterium]
MDPGWYDDLVARIRALPGGIRLVAVDGCGGAGKSTLAARLAADLDGAPILRTDDFASWDNSLDWWPRMLVEAIQPLANGAAARFQRYDWEASRLGGEVVVEPAPVVIIEGVSASRVEWAHMLSFAIWVETPRDVRLRRGLQRDGAAALPLWEQWMADEADYVARDRPDVRADVVVDGTSER